jgi:FkbM family methyltransferase
MFPTKEFDLGLRSNIHFRPLTADEDIIRAVLIDRSEYALFVNCQPKVIFDIGANIGCTSILFANAYPEATIYAFEPEPENFKLLVKNVEAYPNVKPFPIALGARTEKRDLYPSDDEYNLGGFSIHDVGVDKTKPSQTIDVTDIKEFIANEKVPQIDLLKVDTEGCEYEILFRLFLDGKTPEFIMGEMHGVNDWKTLDTLSETHEIQVTKPWNARCFPFYAFRKKPNGNH